MIDTLKLESPEISEEIASAVELCLMTRCGFQNATGELQYELVTGPLEGSFSSSVSVTLKRQRFSSSPPDARGRVCTDLVDSPPYVVIEGSAHKAMLGHNVYGGPERLQEAIAWFVADVGRRFGVSFPLWASWRVLRIDWAEVYDLGSFEACAQYLHGLGLARYPRRKVRRYGDECVFFAGTTTSHKFYHKGPEFSKNGHKVLEHARGLGYTLEVQEKANRYLRVECSIKAKKLKALYGEHPTASSVRLEDLEALHDRETGRVLREAETDMQTVRTTEEVRARLYETYEGRLAKGLFGTWLELAALGEDGVRKAMPRPTYYRHRKQLAEAGIAWDSTDVYIREHSLIPAGFRPVRSDPRRVSGECVKVREALLAVAV
jgi:II/X family phage/plasmid replication protein